MRNVSMPSTLRALLRSGLHLVMSGVVMACGDLDDASSRSGADAGVAVRIVDDAVSTPGSAWRIEEDLRIGVEGGSDTTAVMFGRVYAIAADENGRVYVADAMRELVEVFEQDGTPLHVIGGRGRGPEEFYGLRDVAVVSEDRIVVTDDGNARYTTFSSAGDLQETFLRPIRGFSTEMLGGPMPGGGFLDWVFRFPEGRANGAPMELLPIVLDRDFRVADTFPPVRSAMPGLYYGRTTLGAVDGRGDLWFAHSDEYRLYKRSLQGDTLMIIEVSVEPAPVTLADHEAVAEESDLRPDVLDRRLRNLPTTKPILQRIVSNGNGEILVFVDVEDEVAGTAIDVFTEEGEYLGRTRMPNAIRFPARTSTPVVHATGDHIYVVRHDEVGAPFVARLRIRRDTGSE